METKNEIDVDAFWNERRCFVCRRVVGEEEQYRRGLCEADHAEFKRRLAEVSAEERAAYEMQLIDLQYLAVNRRGKKPPRDTIFRRVADAMSSEKARSVIERPPAKAPLNHGKRKK